MAHLTLSFTQLTADRLEALLTGWSAFPQPGDSLVATTVNGQTFTARIESVEPVAQQNGALILSMTRLSGSPDPRIHSLRLIPAEEALRTIADQEASAAFWFHGIPLTLKAPHEAVCLEGPLHGAADLLGAYCQAAREAGQSVLVINPLGDRLAVPDLPTVLLGPDQQLSIQQVGVSRFVDWVAQNLPRSVYAQAVELLLSLIPPTPDFIPLQYFVNHPRLQEHALSSVILHQLYGFYTHQIFAAAPETAVTLTALPQGQVLDLSKLQPAWMGMVYEGLLLQLLQSSLVTTTHIVLVAPELVHNMTQTFVCQMNHPVVLVSPRVGMWQAHAGVSEVWRPETRAGKPGVWLKRLSPAQEGFVPFQEASRNHGGEDIALPPVSPAVIAEIAQVLEPSPEAPAVLASPMEGTAELGTFPEMTVPSPLPLSAASPTVDPPATPLEDYSIEDDFAGTPQDLQRALMAATQEQAFAAPEETALSPLTPPANPHVPEPEPDDFLNAPLAMETDDPSEAFSSDALSFAEETIGLDPDLAAQDDEPAMFNLEYFMNRDISADFEPDDTPESLETDLTHPMHTAEKTPYHLVDEPSALGEGRSLILTPEAVSEEPSWDLGLAEDLAPLDTLAPMDFSMDSALPMTQDTPDPMIAASPPALEEHLPETPMPAVSMAEAEDPLAQADALLAQLQHLASQETAPLSAIPENLPVFTLDQGEQLDPGPPPATSKSLEERMFGAETEGEDELEDGLSGLERLKQEFLQMTEDAPPETPQDEPPTHFSRSAPLVDLDSPPVEWAASPHEAASEVFGVADLAFDFSADFDEASLSAPPPRAVWEETLSDEDAASPPTVSESTRVLDGMGDALLSLDFSLDLEPVSSVETLLSEMTEATRQEGQPILAQESLAEEHWEPFEEGLLATPVIAKSMSMATGDAPAFLPGDHVRHQRYGHGVVKRVITMDNEQLILNIQFDGVGKRLLDPRLTPLDKQPAAVGG